jgi:flagellin-specific chaperone FliS
MLTVGQVINESKSQLNLAVVHLAEQDFISAVKKIQRVDAVMTRLLFCLGSSLNAELPDTDE